MLTTRTIKLGNFQSKLIDKFKANFTNEQLRWYVVNLYMCLKYHPTKDCPINLEDAYKIIKFPICFII
jgi:hypothetical protein